MYVVYIGNILLYSGTYNHKVKNFQDKIQALVLGFQVLIPIAKGAALFNPLSTSLCGCYARIDNLSKDTNVET
jgi:hypothetical protein